MAYWDVMYISEHSLINFEKTARTLGEDSWELVSVVWEPSEQTVAAGRYVMMGPRWVGFFKRRTG